MVGHKTNDQRKICPFENLTVSQLSVLECLQAMTSPEIRIELRSQSVLALNLRMSRTTPTLGSHCPAPLPLPPRSPPPSQSIPS